MGKMQAIDIIALEILKERPDVGVDANLYAEAAYDLAENYCGRIFLKEAEDFEEIVSVKRGFFFVKAIPISSLTAVYLYPEGVPVEVKTVIPDLGLVELVSHEPKWVRVVYKGGMDELPKDLLIAIRDLAIALYQVDPFITALRAGDASFDISLISPKIAKVLSMYSL